MVHNDTLDEYRNCREGDEHGNMVGEYSVALPDGRIQHVRYNADTIRGTIMEVTYEGEAHHPDIVLPPVVKSLPPTQPVRLIESPLHLFQFVGHVFVFRLCAFQLCS